MSDINKLRAITVGAAKQFKKEIKEWEGEKFEIRQPSVGQRASIMQRAKVATGDVEKMDLAELQIWSTICCVYDPESGDSVFNEADYDSLKNQPSGSFVDEFAQIALKLMNVEAGEAGKN